jgi:hypothetical protein
MQIQSLLCCTLAYLLVSSSTFAVEKRVAIKVKAVRLQYFIPEVRTVVVGPDGRVWYQLDSDPKGRPRLEIRAALEAEYRHAAPQISGATLALLEPDGRAWFYASKGRELWGYDGKNWIEHWADVDTRFVGRCPTRGELFDNLCNRFVGGKVWFRDERGVHVFDGKSWHYRAIGPPMNRVSELPRFAVSPNGKFAVALAHKYPTTFNGLKNPDVWLWDDRSESWQKRQFTWNDAQNPVGTFLITDDGTLWCTQAGMLRKFLLGTADDVLNRVPMLIDQLDDDNFETREKAQAALATIAEQIQPQVAAALEATQSPEKKRRLTALLDQIREFTLRLSFQPGQGQTFGDYYVPSARNLFQDNAGARYVFSSSILDDKVQSHKGFIVVKPDGSTKMFSIKPGSKSLEAGAELCPSPILTPRGDVMWISGAALGKPFISRFDLSSGQITAEVNDSSYHVIRAVDEKDHVFAAKRIYSPADNRDEVMVLFSPEIPEGQGALRRERHAAEPQYAVAPDGVIWANRRGEGLLRYDGEEWQVVDPPAGRVAVPILAGCDGYILCRRDNDDYCLFRNKQFVYSGPLKKLVARQRAEFATAFPPSFEPAPHSSHLWITSDAAKNIWMSDNHTVSVFCRYEWLDTTDAIRATKLQFNGTGPGKVSALGDGNKVYFNCLLADVSDDRVNISKTSLTPQCLTGAVGIPDREGGLWLPGYPSKRTVENRTECRTYHVTGQGTVEEVPLSAWPVLVDKSENLWLSEIIDHRPTNHFYIWRDGALRQEVTIREAAGHHLLFSDKPESVFVWTSLGLHHLLADAAGEFQQDDIFPLPELHATGSGVYSERAGLVVRTSAGGVNELCFIHVPDS